MAVRQQKRFTYRAVNQLPHRHIIPQQPHHLPREHRPSNVPEQPRGVRRSAFRLHFCGLRSEEAIDDGRESAAGVRNDPFERCEVGESLCYGEVHEGACCFEVEFDDAFGVEGWVGAGEAAVGGAEAGSGRVDEDGSAFGGGVGEGEEGFEDVVAEIVAFVV